MTKTDKLLFTRIYRLEAEVEVRTVLHLFPDVPESFRGHGYRSAYTSGYESGWRNKPAKPPYDREHLRSAWREGFDHGKHDSELEIRKSQERTERARAR